jgi:hypothetical protein
MARSASVRSRETVVRIGLDYDDAREPARAALSFGPSDC